MTRTLVLFGRCVGVAPTQGDASVHVDWSDAENFHEASSHMISGEYGNAIIIPVNSTPGSATDAAAVRITVDRASTNFKGFVAHFWLGDKPYDGPEPFDFDWVAYVPCATYLTG